MRYPTMTLLRLLVLVGLVTVGLMALVPDRVQAQGANVFHACRIPDVGVIYMIKEPGLPDNCLSATHVEFSWTEGIGEVADGSITTAKLAAAAVTTNTIADRAVTAAKLESGAVTIPNGAITTAKLADGSVTEAKLGSLSSLELFAAPTGPVSNGLRIVNTSSTGRARIDFIDATRSTISFIQVLNSSPSTMQIANNRSGASIRLSTAGLTRLTVAANGNIGIGTTSPTSRLELRGGSDALNSLVTQRAPGKWIQFGAGLIGSAIKFDNTGFFVIQAGSQKGGSFTETELLRITAGGNVGIGTPSPTQKLHVIGTALANAHTVPSSRRWKQNIVSIEGALDKVQRLRGVSFDWTATGKHDIGLIAEEVGEVIPEVVTYEGDGQDAQSVDYARLVAVLIEAMKEQQEELEELRALVRSFAAGAQVAGRHPDR